MGVICIEIVVNTSYYYYRLQFVFRVGKNKLRGLTVSVVREIIIGRGD